MKLADQDLALNPWGTGRRTRAQTETLLFSLTATVIQYIEYEQYYKPNNSEKYGTKGTH